MKKFFILISAAFALTACTNDIEEATPKQNVEYPNSRVMRNHVSETDYLNKIANSGWKYEVSYFTDFKTGERDTFDFFKGGTRKDGTERGPMIGGGHHEYIFYPNKVVIFYVDLATPAGYTYDSKPTSFDWNISAVYNSNKDTFVNSKELSEYPLMYLESIDGDRLSIITPVFSCSDKEPVAGYLNQYFTRMTPEELEATCKKHGYEM